MLKVTASVSSRRILRTAPILVAHTGPGSFGVCAQAGRGAVAARRAAEDADAKAGVGLRSYLLYLGVAFVLAVALSWSYSTTARLGYRIDELKSEISALKGQNEKLSYELSGYESLIKVESRALALGMVRPEHVRPTPVIDGAAVTASATASATVSASASATVSETAAVRVIRLGPTEAGAEAGDAVASAAPGGEGGGLGSLWERFYRWLTGVSQAEARDWQ